MANLIYKMSDEKLVGAFAVACAKLGAVDSGLMTLVLGPFEEREIPEIRNKAINLRNVLLARLERQKKKRH